MQAGVFIISAAILAYEVVLMRMFSIAQWHHFAAMTISIALLGFGVSGTVLAIWREPLQRRCRFWFVSSLMGFFLAVPVCTGLAQAIPLRPMLMIWQPGQAVVLLGVYLLLVVPFAIGALAIGLALGEARARGTVGRVYAFSLLGSGFGAWAGLALCFLPLPVEISEYKALTKSLAMANARLLHTSHHPLGRMDLVDSPALRVAPGLSMAYTGSIPRQQALFVDAGGGSAVNPSSPDEDLGYLEWLPSAVAYQVRPVSRALIVGVGGGSDLQQAQRFGVRRVLGVEMHPRVAELAARNAPGTEVRVAEGRAYLRASREVFDLIQISLLDSLAAAVAGLGAANESYLYTVEAFGELIGHLGDHGILCITRWLKTPPRDNIKLMATATTALERNGAEDPAAQMIFLRGWATGTLLLKRSPFSSAEVGRVRQWSEDRGFDLDYFPGATEQDVNRYNVMEEPVYFRAAQAILHGDRSSFYRDHLFQVRPATDYSPHFFHFFRWKTAPHLWRTMGRSWLPFVEWGYLMLLATLVQAGLASVVLIGLPLVLAKTSPGRSLRAWGRIPTGASRCSAVFVYFAGLGLAFMFVEIALLQRFTLFLGHPLSAAAVVIAAMLVFAGLGSSLVGGPVRDARWPAIVIAGLVIAYLFALPGIFSLLLATPLAVRTLVTILLLAPPSLFMGMMFPLGLGRTADPLVPWAWGINGCFSVIGAVLAAVLSMDFGIAAVMGAAAFLYVATGAMFRRLG